MGKKKLVISQHPYLPSVSSADDPFFFPLFFGCLSCWGLVIARVYVLKKKGREKKKQTAELYIFLMEGDTVGALRINLDARIESWSPEKMANISVAQ